MDDKSSRNQKPVEKKFKKNEQLDQFRVQNTGKPMTTNQGRKISDDEDQLKAGERGPSLRQDWHYFEKK